MKLPKLPKIRKKKEKEGYNYTDDINWDNCVHDSTDIFEVKPEWEIDTVSIIIECKNCFKIGETNGTIKYDEKEINWYEESI